jgi:acyl-CoA synthetase (AMP-forming)/AMP-acid ligase II
VALVGFKSTEWGDAVKAFVVLNPGAKCGADSLKHFCKQLFASYKAPKVVEFVPPSCAPVSARSIEEG